MVALEPVLQGQTVNARDKEMQGKALGKIGGRITHLKHSLGRNFLPKPSCQSKVPLPLPLPQ